MEKTYIQPELPDGTEIAPGAQESEPIFDERELVLEQYANTPMAYSINGETYYAQGSHHAIMLCEFLQNERLPAAFFAVKFGEAANLYTTLEKDISESLEDELSELTQSTDAEKDSQPQTENTSDSAGVIESGKSEAQKVDEKSITSPWMPPESISSADSADKTPETKLPVMTLRIENNNTPADTTQDVTITPEQTATTSGSDVRAEEAPAAPSALVEAAAELGKQVVESELQDPTENEMVDTATELQPLESQILALPLLAPAQHDGHHQPALVESNTVVEEDGDITPTIWPHTLPKSDLTQDVKPHGATNEALSENVTEVALTTPPNLDETFIHSTEENDSVADFDNEPLVSHTVTEMEIDTEVSPIDHEESLHTIDMILEDLETFSQNSSMLTGDILDQTSEGAQEEKIALLYKCYEAQVALQTKANALSEETSRNVHHALAQLLEEIGFEDPEMHARIYLEKYGASNAFDTHHINGYMSATPQDFNLVERYRQLASLAVGLIIHGNNRHLLTKVA
ncbi:MAG: hypothetical protein UY35_C0003G0009 [Candidatus Saccharibacteria bacterium GW2011_GWC2_48_9]|nr:MAG: hypothetical protein UY35_C0003G0009 [Candidatus Saccharibacteria bacterium GW2011_GWC2_48_9]